MYMVIPSRVKGKYRKVMCALPKGIRKQVTPNCFQKHFQKHFVQQQPLYRETTDTMLSAHLRPFQHSCHTLQNMHVFAYYAKPRPTHTLCDMIWLTWSTWLYLAMSLWSVLSMIIATMPERKSTITREFMMLQKHTTANQSEPLKKLQHVMIIQITVIQMNTDQTRPLAITWTTGCWYVA